MRAVIYTILLWVIIILLCVGQPFGDGGAVEDIENSFSPQQITAGAPAVNPGINTNQKRQQKEAGDLQVTNKLEIDPFLRLTS